MMLAAPLSAASAAQSRQSIENQQSRAPAFQENGAFQRTACMFDVPGGTIEGQDVICGYLTVPEEHANPDGPTIELAVAIIKSRVDQPKADPLVMAQGGPGGSTIETYAAMLLGQNDLSPDRDIILFDQRGTLYSKPVLYCDEMDRVTIDTLDKNLSIEETERLYREAVAKCYNRLSSKGINLSAFDSLENAADIESLRQALGYEKINLYGVSYGTLLALHTMRLFPTSLRSVILDGVVPPQTNFIVNVAQTENRSFTRLFDTCKADPDCNRSYPDLEKVFFELVDQLNQKPAIVQMTDPENGTVYDNVVISGEAFISGVFQFLYSSDLVKALPRIIYDAKDGEFGVFARILSIFVLDRTTSYGMYYSVLCAEDADFQPSDQDLTGVRPQIAKIEGSSPADFLATCNIWKVSPLDAGVDAPVVSDIPTLVLSGGFDPITPPDYAKSAADSLSHAYNYVFPNGGHGQALDSDCANQIIRQFLNDPLQAPDSTCIDPNAPVQFLTPKTVVDLPFILKGLNLHGPSLLIVLLLGLGLLFLWSAALIFPTAWLVRVLRRKPATVPTGPAQGGYPAAELQSYNNPGDNPASSPNILAEARPSFLARFSGWWPVLAAALLTVFLVFVTVTLVSMVNANDTRLFYGLPGETRPWFVLPVLFALLGLVILVTGVILWARRSGSIWRRVYYSLLALDALSMIAMLAYLGMLTALFL